MKGISKTVWVGRFEQINDNPRIIIDGAHNPDAVAQLKATLDKSYNNTTFVFIMGVLADKDFSTEISMMSDYLHYVITVTPNNPRALDAGVLAKTISDIVQSANDNIDEITIEKASSIEEGVELAVKLYNDISGDKAILAFGSLSYLGRLRSYVKERYR